MSTLATNAITDASGGNTATINSYTPTESNMAGRNRIINGDMRIDQRNAGASVAVSNSTPNFITDRFAARNVSNNLTAQQVTDAPSGFVNSLKITVGTGASPSSANRNGLSQNIEGYNVADLDYGAATAKTVTVSFWVKSSLTGTFGAALRDTGTEATATYSYVFNYVINTANTWEYKTATIDGNTSGSWNKTNGLGLSLMFDLGSGSNLETTTNQWASGNYVRSSSNVILGETSGATWQVTGVQLEAGSVATPFEHRQYGQELALCQRYFESGFPAGVAVADNTTYAYFNGGALGATAYATNALRTLSIDFMVPKRTSPTVILYRVNSIGSANHWVYYNPGAGWTNYSDATNVVCNSNTNFNVRSTQTSTAGIAYMIDGQWSASAEL